MAAPGERGELGLERFESPGRSRYSTRADDAGDGLGELGFERRGPPGEVDDGNPVVGSSVTGTTSSA